MAVFKCKMCGGALEVSENSSTVTCEYCGSQQTLPKLNDDKLARLYDRANHFRRNNEFDKAMGIYEQILDEDNTDAEAYWSIVLCRYGIEYVEDPTTHKRIPTINRAQYTSIFDDDNYTSALKYADIFQKKIYEEEAVTINEIQKGILEISQKEDPFDVFICYKETDDATKQRTHDSVYATELYHELTEVGFKVFFSRITLEDKLGQAYEPYIFAALNSAKVMVVMGTKPEYFNGVWVKNEWSRYLSLIKNGAKKLLIPAYRDMDPYDLPQEFSHLQALDMNKLGFMPDLVRGIKKIINKEPAKQAPAYDHAPQPAYHPPVQPKYNVRLVSDGGKKLECIKAVRECLGLGLSEAKDLVESRARTLASQVSYEEANEIENFFIRNGFEVAIEEVSGYSSPIANNGRCNVKLAPVGERKLLAIKVVREVCNLGLKEAKDIVESRNPVLASNISFRQAEEIQQVFQSNQLDVIIEPLGGYTAPSYKAPYSVPATSGSGNVDTLLKRVALFLEGEDWSNADLYCEKVLDIDPENARAYIGKLLAKLRVSREEDLVKSESTLENWLPYKNALRFADEATAERLISYNKQIKERLRKEEEERQERARIEEERRQEQARIERERRAKLDAERAERAKADRERQAVINAQKNVSDRLQAQVREKERVENLIALREREIADAPNPKKVRGLARMVIFVAILLFASIVLVGIMESLSIFNTLVTILTYNLLVALFVCLLFVLIIAYFVLGGALCKANGASAAMTLLNVITYGIFSFAYAIYALKKNKKGSVSPAVSELNSLKKQLEQINQNIDTSRESLKEINKKLN